jgi:two-component system KDP operon response regulator KdpE
MSRILIIDDEPQLLRALDITLRARRYEVETAATGAEGLTLASRRTPDAVILDLGLPDMDGVEVLQALRGWTQIPIVVLSGRSDSLDKVEALDFGADDYVTKPFSMEELLARLRVVLRRGVEPEGAVAVIGRCRVDQAAHLVTRLAPEGSEDEDEVVHLTPTEWSLLEVLLRHPGRMVGTKQILAEVWGPGTEHESGYVRFHMVRLRRKLETDPTRPRHLLTEPGMGYRYQP